MPIDQGGIPQDDIHDQLNGKGEIDLSAYEETIAPTKDRKQEFLDQGYVVIKENEQEDVVLMGKLKGESNDEEKTS